MIQIEGSSSQADSQNKMGQVGMGGVTFKAVTLVEACDIKSDGLAFGLAGLQK